MAEEITDQEIEYPEQHWNWRVAKSIQDGQDVVGIHEAFYHYGKLDGWSPEPVGPTAPSLDLLRLALQHKIPSASDEISEGDYFSEKTRLEAWLEACDEPILTEDESTES